ncbi:hypothetical protein HV213_22220 [Klebsiella sp. RHBSTW-00484]|uniref:hypothetical protein n=1 Tax=unclassified Klebsiella TaxID=2608929 RepID=UPI0015E545E5|nr:MULTISPECIES: hypothetical protein [unclassified Klebsiella]MBA7845717.1 hypothetical protein [Klebsiella sp. RHBSTW-00465]QLO38343.1 hypothetical protein HV213_22220 [Klebsiella sp. RHBSTW-00484]QLT77863.1 hypothetical protein HV204_22220 [Klebsiella sp. RHBSTW-00464]
MNTKLTRRTKLQTIKIAIIKRNEKKPSDKEKSECVAKGLTIRELVMKAITTLKVT